MSDSAMIHSLFAQVQRIVELQQEIASVRERRDEAAKVHKSLEQQTRDLEQQLKSAKKLLNHCIDTGEDPIAVQLSGSLQEPADVDESLDSVINSYAHQIFGVKPRHLTMNDLLLPTSTNLTRNKI